MDDDLASMMSRNLHLGAMHPAINDLSSTPPTPQVVPQTPSITYISQHYHHSAHLAPVQMEEETSMSSILRQAGVDTNALLPSQFQLFRNAQPDQQARLIELWRIAPPSYGDQLPAGSTGNWPQTSMQQEEEAARQRYERQERDKLKNLSILPGQVPAEPYMQDGYNDMAQTGNANQSQNYRPATDPAYAPSREWWNMTGNEPIEHQYGLLQAIEMQYGSCGGMDRDHMMD